MTLQPLILRRGQPTLSHLVCRYCSKPERALAASSPADESKNDLLIARSAGPPPVASARPWQARIGWSATLPGEGYLQAGPLFLGGDAILSKHLHQTAANLVAKLRQLQAILSDR